MLHVSQCEIDVIVTLLIDQTALIYSHPTGLRDRYLRETQACGFRGCVLAPAANIFPPEEGVCLFASGGWPPPNPETRHSSLVGSGRDALARVPACLTLLGMPWSPALSWLHTVLVGSCCRDPFLSSTRSSDQPCAVICTARYARSTLSFITIFTVIDENN